MRLQSVQILFLTGFVLLGGELHDVRMVKGIQVDLAPVHAWVSDRKGERPMEHWREIQMTEVKDTVGRWELCVGKNECGEPLDPAVANVARRAHELLAV